MGFEPTRAEPIGLAVQRLNHSATLSCHNSSQTKWTNFLYTQNFNYLTKWCNFQTKKKMAFSNKIIPTPGVEPGPPGWKPDILAVRPRGMMFLSGIEPETFCVLGRRDNRYTIETC